jgi:hypothetical protein
MPSLLVGQEMARQESLSGDQKAGTDDLDVVHRISALADEEHALEPSAHR